MDHAWNLTAVLCLDRQAVAAVSLGDDSILQVGAGAAAYHGRELGADAVIGLGYGSPDLTQRGAGIVRDLIFRENTAADLCSQGCQRLQLPEHLIQRIIGKFIIFPAGIGLHPVRGLQQLAHA